MVDERLVVDASVAIKWIILEEGSILAVTLRTWRLCAPDLLLVECEQSLWREFRRRTLSHDDALRSYVTLGQAPIAWTPTGELAADAVAIAMTLGHSVYDCVYVALARRLNTSLVTADTKLTAAARRSRAPARLVRPLSG